MTAFALRVIKLGGSLLDLPDLSSRVERWLASQPPLKNIVIAGGGLMVDNLRRECAAGKIDDASAHRLALQAMSMTSRLVSAAIGVPLISTVPTKLDERFAAQQEDATLVLDTFMTICGVPAADDTSDTSLQCDLPQNWDVTSDSIAAWVAREAAAQEVVLFKSALPPGTCRDWTAAVEVGYVDLHFPKIAAELAAVPIRCVNMRDDALSEWSPSPPTTS